MNTRFLDELSRRLSEGLPPGLAGSESELRRHLRAMLEGMVNRLELVPREEFEVQKAVLARTRQKLKALEERLAALEAKGEEESSGPAD